MTFRTTTAVLALSLSAVAACAAAPAGNAQDCRKSDVKLGLYYSLWDRHEKTHEDKDPEKYVRFMRNQLTELLTNYRPVCELWFDGGWAKTDADWNIPSIYKPIHELQPRCAVTVNHTIPTPAAIMNIR